MSPFKTMTALLFGLSTTALTVGACQQTGERVVEPASGGGGSSRSPSLDTDAAVIGPIANDQAQPKAAPPTPLPTFGLPQDDRVASRATPSQFGPGGAGGMPGTGGQTGRGGGGGGISPSPRQIGLR